MLVLLKYNTSTVLRVGGNPPSLIIDDDFVSCQLIHPQDDVKTLRSTVSKIPEISNSQPRHIIPILALIPRGELTYKGSSKVSTSKPNSITTDTASLSCKHSPKTLFTYRKKKKFHTPCQCLPRKCKVNITYIKSYTSKFLKFLYSLIFNLVNSAHEQCSKQ